MTARPPTLEERRAALREHFRVWRAERERERQFRRAQVSPAPRYDEVFFAGTAWLDSLARDGSE